MASGPPEGRFDSYKKGGSWLPTSCGSAQGSAAVHLCSCLPASCPAGGRCPRTRVQSFGQTNRTRGWHLSQPQASQAFARHQVTTASRTGGGLNQAEEICVGRGFGGTRTDCPNVMQPEEVRTPSPKRPMAFQDQNSSESPVTPAPQWAPRTRKGNLRA